MPRVPVGDFDAIRFRGFRDLRLEGLGRANLFVGKNSVGKSSLLEALRLWASGGALPTIHAILTARGEVLRTGESNVERYASVERSVPTFSSLFYGRQGEGRIELGPRPGPRVSIEQAVMVDEAQQLRVDLFESDSTPAASRNVIVVSAGDRPKRPIPIDPDQYSRTRRFAASEEPDHFFPVEFVPSSSAVSPDLSDLWDNIVLTGLEEDVLSGLRLLDPSVQRLTFIREGSTVRRVPVVKLEGTSEPLPLRSLGDGMSRVLRIVLALVNANSGLLLVDEAENGIHYKAQPRLWSLVLELATRLNVQVFATTHSWDCVQAFAAASTAKSEADALLVRLETRGGVVLPVPFTEREMVVAAREQIELR